MAELELMCSVFHCDHRSGKYCCAECPNPCANRCLNHPDRCNLSQLLPPHKSRGRTRQRLTEEQKTELRRLLGEGGMTHKAIAEQVGVYEATVTWYGARIRREVERNGG